MAIGQGKWIKVSINTYNELSKIGKFGETFNDVVTKLVEYYNHTNREKQEEVKN